CLASGWGSSSAAATSIWAITRGCWPVDPLACGAWRRGAEWAGPLSESEAATMRILLVGGTGFLGRHVAARLARDGHILLVPTRQYARGRDLQLLPGLTLLEADVHDDAALDRMLQESDAVINLAGILHGGHGRPYGAGFARVHVELPRRLAQACRRHDVRRLLHVS